jgi:hypothetical protein
MRSKGNLWLLLNANRYEAHKDGQSRSHICVCQQCRGSKGWYHHICCENEGQLLWQQIFLPLSRSTKANLTLNPGPQKALLRLWILVEGGSEQLSEDIETGVKRDTAEV